MSARDDAARLRAWAEANGLFSQGRGSIENSALAGEGMFSVDVLHTLQRKPVTAIGYAENPAEAPRIFIYTRRKLTCAEKHMFESDSPVDTRLVFRSAKPFSVNAPSTMARSPLVICNGRMACGGSISVGNNREAGTLGALLRDADGKIHGLSCNHVTGGCSNARPGLPVVAPGILDVGAGINPPRTIGQHVRSLQFIAGDPSSIATYRANLDAAVFSIDEPLLHSSSQGGIFDTPERVSMPREDTHVEKIGRSTGHTHGIVESCLIGAQRIDYRLTAYHSAEESSPFSGSVFFEPIYIVRGKAGPFAIEGDSGALVVARHAQGGAGAVGLVIGGDRINDVTYMLPLQPVLDALGMTLVSGLHGV